MLGLHVRDLDGQEPEAADCLIGCAMDGERGVMASTLPEVNDELLDLINVQGVIVLAAYSQIFYLPPVGTLIIIADEVNHGGVVCKLDSVAPMHSHTVWGEQIVQQ